MNSNPETKDSEKFDADWELEQQEVDDDFPLREISNWHEPVVTFLLKIILSNEPHFHIRLHRETN